MRINRFITHLVMVAWPVLIAWLPAPPTQAAAPSSGGATLSASAGGLGAMASGAAEDTLKACLARIPKDASAGQLMIAQQGCERDEASRKEIRAVPGS